MTKGCWEQEVFFFGDGSGGEDTADPRLRRCGLAVVLLTSQSPPFAARSGGGHNARRGGAAEHVGVLAICLRIDALSVSFSFNPTTNPS